MAINLKFTEGAISVPLRQDSNNPPLQITGAVASFTGIVRKDNVDGEEVIGIEFTSHEKIAKEACHQLMTKSIKKYHLHCIRIIHSLGFVKTGEVCFYIEIHSSHRKEAFLALPEIVDDFKSQVPVFGKEILSNNKYAWKENKY
jgi:molybdopterin synthase catalytic subunit